MEYYERPVGVVSGDGGAGRDPFQTTEPDQFFLEFLLTQPFDILLPQLTLESSSARLGALLDGWSKQLCPNILAEKEINGRPDDIAKKDVDQRAARRRLVRMTAKLLELFAGTDAKGSLHLVPFVGAKVVVSKVADGEGDPTGGVTFEAKSSICDEPGSVKKFHVALQEEPPHVELFRKLLRITRDCTVAIWEVMQPDLELPGTEMTTEAVLGVVKNRLGAAETLLGVFFFEAVRLWREGRFMFTSY